MGAFDKIASVFKIDTDEDEYDDYYGEDDTPVKNSFIPAKGAEEDASAGRKPAKAMTPAPKKVVNGNMEVVRIKPTSIEEGRRITSLLLEGKVVFLDVEDIDVKISQRVLDYVSGASFAIDGTLQQMSHSTYVIAPPAVYISGDFAEQRANNVPSSQDGIY